MKPDENRCSAAVFWVVPFAEMTSAAKIVNPSYTSCSCDQARRAAIVEGWTDGFAELEIGAEGRRLG
jgi:hypothetical protein